MNVQQLNENFPWMEETFGIVVSRTISANGNNSYRVAPVAVDQRFPPELSLRSTVQLLHLGQWIRIKRSEFFDGVIRPGQWSVHPHMLHTYAVGESVRIACRIQIYKSPRRTKRKHSVLMRWFPGRPPIPFISNIRDYRRLATPQYQGTTAWAVMEYGHVKEGGDWSEGGCWIIRDLTL